LDDVKRLWNIALQNYTVSWGLRETTQVNVVQEIAVTARHTIRAVDVEELFTEHCYTK
jgi:hypothetical protein